MATNPPIYPQPPKSGSNLPLALAGGAIVAMLAGNIYLFTQIQDLKKDASKTNEALQAEIEKLEENTTAVGATSRKHSEQLREQLDVATRQTLAAAHSEAQKAKQEAVSSVLVRVVQKLESLGQSRGTNLKRRSSSSAV